MCVCVCEWEIEIESQRDESPACYIITLRPYLLLVCVCCPNRPSRMVRSRLVARTLDCAPLLRGKGNQMMILSLSPPPPLLYSMDRASIGNDDRARHFDFLFLETGDWKEQQQTLKKDMKNKPHHHFIAVRAIGVVPSCCARLGWNVIFQST